MLKNVRFLEVQHQLNMAEKVCEFIFDLFTYGAYQKS